MAALFRLLGYLRGYPWRVVLVVLSILGATAFSLVVPWIVKIAIDVGLTSGDMRLMILLAVGVVVTTVLRGLSAFGQTYLGEYLSQRVAYDLRNEIYDHVQRLSFSFHDRNQTGQLMSRATQDVEAVRMFFSFGLVNVLQTSLLMGGILIILVQVNARLALITLVALPIAAVAAVRIGSSLRPTWLKIQQQTAVLTTYLQESLAGIRVVKAFAREQERLDGFAGVNVPLHRLNVRAARLQAFNWPFLGMLLSITTAISLWVGGVDVVGKSLTVGELAAYVAYLGLLNMPVRRLGFIVNLFARTVASAERVFELLDTSSDVQERHGAIDLPDVHGQVVFESVAFGYEQQADVLVDIDIVAHPGEVIALLGATGSGKSTITLLIPRFYDVTSGKITIDGHDIRDLSLSSLRKQIGIVLQDSFLFSATIRDNIAYGAENISFERIVEAAKLAGAHEFIQRLPDGYDTWVGERGVTLSGGQKQRVAIARTILLDPRVLVLDDSTSSVDTETEFKIQKALQLLMRGRTTFVIAHRLRTVKHADQILILDNGRIVERGRHDELLAANGIYRQIYDLQLRDQEELADQLADLESTGGAFNLARVPAGDRGWSR